MHFRILGLPAEQFAPLFAMSDAALAERGAVRRIAAVSYTHLTLPTILRV